AARAVDVNFEVVRADRLEDRVLEVHAIDRERLRGKARSERETLDGSFVRALDDDIDALSRQALDRVDDVSIARLRSAKRVRVTDGERQAEDPDPSRHHGRSSSLTGPKVASAAGWSKLPAGKAISSRRSRASRPPLSFEIEDRDGPRAPGKRLRRRLVPAQRQTSASSVRSAPGKGKGGGGAVISPRKRKRRTKTGSLTSIAPSSFASSASAQPGAASPRKSSPSIAIASLMSISLSRVASPRTNLLSTMTMPVMPRCSCGRQK